MVFVWVEDLERTVPPMEPELVEESWSVVLPGRRSLDLLDSEWKALTIGRDMAYVLIEFKWEGLDLLKYGEAGMYSGLNVTGTVYLSEVGRHMLGVDVALGFERSPVFGIVEACLPRVIEEVKGDMEVRVRQRVQLGDPVKFAPPTAWLSCLMPPFMMTVVFGSAERAKKIYQSVVEWSNHFQVSTLAGFYDLSVEKGPFFGNQAQELLETFDYLEICEPRTSFEGFWHILEREVEIGENYLAGVAELFEEDE